MAEENTLPLLNDRQDLFCREYIIDFNGKQAAIRAGYSEISATSTASEILTYPNIQARITELKQDIFAAVGLTQAKIYRELARLALCDITNAFEPNGALKQLSDIDVDTRSAIIGIDVDEIKLGDVVLGNTKKVRFADKLNALNQLVKIAGWAAPEKREISGSVELSNLPIVIK
jgi:phage terminase small subunit